MRLASVLVALNLLSIILIGADTDPFIGKWMLNCEKSQSTQPRPKSVIRSYQQSGNGVRVQKYGWTSTAREPAWITSPATTVMIIRFAPRKVRPSLSHDRIRIPSRASQEGRQS